MLRQNILHQITAIKRKVTTTLTKQQVKLNVTLTKKICILIIFTVAQQIYTAKTLLTLITNDEKTSTRYKKLL